MKRIDVLIIGGGVSGAAAAYTFSKYDFKTALIEKENDVACGSTKANSALIHSGFDPEPDTLMGKYNARGNALAQQIAAKLSVPFKKTGSFVLAFDEEQDATLRHLHENGKKNGVITEIWPKEKVLAKEPSLSDEITSALWAESCGIISPWEYTAAMCEVAILNGVDVHVGTEARSITRGEDGLFIVDTSGESFQAEYIVNAAGLYADIVHEMAGGSGYRITAARGEYYLLDKPQGKLVSAVIFQSPTQQGKGVVVGPTVHGNLFVGPDNHVAERDDTATHADELVFIRNTALKSVPLIDYSQNIRNFAGLRAVGGRDFIVGPSEQVKNFFNVAGIKSPGLSSAPAIAEDVLNMLADAGLPVKEKKDYVDERHVVRFAELPMEKQAEIVKQNPAYGHVVCRCQTITEGEIVDILHRPLSPFTMDGIKRRCSSGMGRCQGGFCEPRIHAIIAREKGMAMKDVLQDVAGSYIVVGETKGG